MDLSTHVQGLRATRKVESEEGGNIFIMDSKTFTLGFDGGRVDPYHIMERRRRFRGSMWLGLGGLQWVVNMILKLRNSNGTLEGFFEFFRDGYRVIEISCLSNHGGRFLDVSEYHSGTHQGNIRIHDGWRGARWLLFEFQVHKFFLCEIAVSDQCLGIPRRTASEGKLAVGIPEDCNGRWIQSRQSRKSRVFKDFARFAPSPKTGKEKG